MKYYNDSPLKVLLVALLVSSAAAIRHLRIVSPLQALTIWDKELPTNDTWRNRFLGKFRAGLAAETSARKAMEGQQQQSAPAASSASKNPKWALQAQRREQAKYAAQEKAAEAAFDKAVAQVDRQQKQQLAQAKKQQSQNPNSYQFVGVVQPAKSTEEQAITWYARKKPSSAKWSVRLVHVNQRAVIKDLFDRGHVDVFGKYSNTGQRDPETGTPLIASEYSIRKRSWRNLWNFSPKHMFTDSSGMYWRERRLRPGLYTDGKTVYESTYRYKDGRNGMHQYSSLNDFLKSKSVAQGAKDKIVKRLAKDSPDLVLEE